MTFLRSFDDELAVLALRVMAALASPPSTHKCLEESRHETELHKTVALCNPFFDIGTYDLNFDNIYSASLQLIHVVISYFFYHVFTSSTTI